MSGMVSSLAAIDIGTNSVHLVIAKPRPDGGFDILAKEKESVRLGRGADDLDELTPEAIERGVEVLRRYRLLAEGHDARIAAVGTSAVREATNSNEFIQRARDEAGIDIDVISGTEEARLIYLGAQQALPLFHRRALVVDIGGGSTEFVLGEGSRIAVARSLKLGAIRLTDRFATDGSIEADQVDKARSYIRAYLSPAVSAMSEIPRDIAVGCSGTIMTLAAMSEARSDRTPQTLNGVALEASTLKKIERQLLSTPLEKRSEIPGMDERRADIIVAGAMLLRGIFEVFEISEMVVSEYALREGVVFDRLQVVPERFHHLSDPRRESVLALAASFDEDLDHVSRATDHSLRLFDGLVDIHGLDTEARDVLEAAAMLHNVGLFVSHSAHHKHSYYVIRNTDRLAGFTDTEIELIALVARYHRKALPRSKHLEYSALDRSTRDSVSILAGMLRIGIALDRSRSGVVTDLSTEADDDGVIVRLTTEPDIDWALEQFMVDERKDLLESALDRPVTFLFGDADGL
jgi:exopolyphosphatase/guanosine-5'-triphosphate,3'-diphosphate pyrophosphatase